MLTPLFRATEQLSDPVFLGVVLRSLGWSLVAFVLVVAGAGWGVQHLVHDPGWVGWAAGVAGGLGALVLALFLFVPVAVAIATLYSDRVAAAVDHRYYPGLPEPVGAALSVQVWDGVALGARVLALQVVALGLALAIPGIGLVLGWAITGWAIGRGLFVAVAMRRMGRGEATALYRERRPLVLVQGGLLALLASVPVLNLVVPVLGVAALTHLLNRGGHPRLSFTPMP